MRYRVRLVISSISGILSRSVELSFVPVRNMFLQLSDYSFKVRKVEYLPLEDVFLCTLENDAVNTSYDSCRDVEHWLRYSEWGAKGSD